MEKKPIGAKTFLYPMPTIIVGARVNGRPNFLTVAYCGIAQHSPPMIMITLGKSHFTNAGIRESGTFSVNIPSADMVKITDYAGMVSGKSTDKSALFTAFYGRLETAPLIAECPLCLECKLVTTVDMYGTNDVFIGEIVESYTDDRYLTNGLPDIKKIDPLVFSMHDNNYWRVGDHVARAWSVGREYGKP